MSNSSPTKAPSETPIWDAAYDRKQAARTALLDAIRERLPHADTLALVGFVVDLELAVRDLANTPLK